MSNKDGELDLEKFISYDKETDTSQCLVPECNTIFIGKKELAIKRHYHIAHDADIEENQKEEMSNIYNTNNHNSGGIGDGNTHVYYSIKYLNDNTKSKIKSHNAPKDSPKGKGYRTFLIADYVEYCKKTNVSKCLIKNCERPMSGRRTGNIKRHFQKVHNFVIVHDNLETIRSMNKELYVYYNSVTFGDSTYDEENEDEMSDVLEQQSSGAMVFEKYIDYDPLINKSICKVPGCKTFLQGKNHLNIKRHYNLVHNYDIEYNGPNVYNSKYLTCNGQFQNTNTSVISVEDLVVYNLESSSYHCLFMNCNKILEKHLPTIKRHYHEFHKIIIARVSDNITQRFYRKRKYFDTNSCNESARENDGYIEENASCFVDNEVLSDGEHPHCSKRQKNNSTFMNEIKSCSSKYPKSAKVELTKTGFLKLCLNLVIERNLKINLFDDEILFKKLLTPFEELFEFQVNSTVIEDLMIKANNIVLSGLKEKFCNKILCLELHVVNFEKKYYTIFNIRFLSEQIICNNVIVKNMETGRNLDIKINLEQFIIYGEKTNIAKCLVPECQTIFVEKNELAIKRHYHLVHDINVEESVFTNEELPNIPYNDWDGDLIECPKNKRNEANYSNNHLIEGLEDKGYITFLVADYVEYCKETNISKCLIKNCERLMSGRRTGNIKRHYQKVHNFVIVHGSSRSYEDNEENVYDVLEQNLRITVNLDKYFDYDPVTNKSLCKVPGCNTALVGKKPNNIMRHYKLVHNYKIESNERKNDWNKTSLAAADNAEQPVVPVEYLVAYDIETSSYQCLFLNCNQILDLDWTTIKKHYYEMHRIIITKDPDNIPNRFFRKRKYRYIHKRNNKSDEFSTSDQDEQPHCSSTIELPFELPEMLGKTKCRKFPTSCYVEYCESTNISKCLIKNCKRLMSGMMSSNIKRHYHTIHNMIIIHGLSNTIKDKNKNETTHGIDVNNFLSYDIQTSYQCLFSNCNCSLEVNLQFIKIHYLEMHKVIIVRNLAKKQRGVKQGLYIAVSTESQDNMNAIVTGINKSDIDKPHCSKTLEDSSESLKEKRYTKFAYTNYVEYNKEANIAKCLIENCKKIMMGRIVKNIKTHYRTLHKMIINISPEEDDESYDECGEQSNVKVCDYVVCDKESYRCLFIKCNQILEKHLPTIRKHYREIHKTIIATESEYIIYRRRRYKELHGLAESDNSNDNTCPIRNEFLSDEELPSQRLENPDYILSDCVDGTETEPNKHIFLSDYDKPHCSKTLNKPLENCLVNFKENHCSNFVFANYVQYNKYNDKSKCLIKYCQKFLSGRIVRNIRRHYKRMHNLKIGIEISLEDDELSDETGPQADMKISDLLEYDKRTFSYQCIFLNCNHILDKNLRTIKKHYLEVHKAIIDSNYNYVICNIRRHYEAHRSKEYISDNDSYSIRNELLSDEEQASDSQPPDIDYMDETISYSIKKEFISDEEQPYTPIKSNETLSKSNETTTTSPPHLTEKSSDSIKITSTKQACFKLCLDLIIQRDLCLNLFDDDLYFKTLLLPYEQVLDCHINSSLMLDLMRKANDVIVDALKNNFSNKIVCLELHVINQEKNYYLILNVRLLDNQSVVNKLIGFLPITEARTDALPIFEYLSKFNIEKQQLYMTTIIGGLQDDEEINNICNDLCNHNSSIRKHPICNIQTILRSFMQKYSEDIKSWQELANYNCKSNMETNLLSNLIEFTNYMENLSKTDIELKPQLKEANLFLKTLKILRNLLAKLTEEQHVAGDLYRDWLCCELELKGELQKNNNKYAGKLYEDLTECKNTLLQSDEYLAALYLDARFNFLGSRLLSDTQKTKGKQHLCTIREKFNKYLQSTNSNADPLPANRDSDDDPYDDEYALLNQHINDIMPIRNHKCIEDMITDCVPTKREPFSLDVLKYWQCKPNDMKDIIELTKIAFLFSSSQHVLIHLQTNFAPSHSEAEHFDKFLIKNNQDILEKNIDLILKDYK